MVEERYQMYFIEVFAAVLSLVVAYVTGKLSARTARDEERHRKEEEERRAALEYNRALGEGVKSILQFRIKLSYEFHTRNGFIPTEEMPILESMYKSYHGLGGNGTITALYNEMMSLPHQKMPGEWEIRHKQAL